MFQKKYGNVTIQMVQAAKRGLCLMASRGHQRILFDFVGDDPERVPDGTNAYMFGNKLILVTRWSDMSEEEKETVRESPLTLALHPGECIQMSLKIENAWGDVTLTLPHCVSGLNDENAPVDELIFLFGDTHDENFLISRNVLLPPFIQEVLRKANESTHRIMPMDQEIQALSRKAAEDPSRDFCDYFYAACLEKTENYALKARELDPAHVPDGIYIEIDGNDIIKNLYKNQKNDAAEPEKENGEEKESSTDVTPAPQVQEEAVSAVQPEYPPAINTQESPAAQQWAAPAPPVYPPEIKMSDAPVVQQWNDRPVQTETPASVFAEDKTVMKPNNAEAENTPEYSDDVKVYLALAEKGVPEGAYNMGVCCEHGDGIAQNAEQAVEWYAKAAAQGFAKAIFNLGVCKYNGFGTQADRAAAAALFHKAAEAGDMYAQYNYGVCLFNGDGVAADAESAMQWLRKSADQGNEMAAKALAQQAK